MVAVDVGFDYRFVIHKGDEALVDEALVAVHAPLFDTRWLASSYSAAFCYLCYPRQDPVAYRVYSVHSQVDTGPHLFRVHSQVDTGLGEDPDTLPAPLGLNDRMMHLPLTIMLASKSALYPAPLSLVLKQHPDLNELLRVLQKQFAAGQ